MPEAIHCIYLYYAKFDNQRRLRQLTTHYFLSGADAIDDPPTATIDGLIRDIAKRPKYHPSCIGDNFMDMRRRRLSYFVVVVEDALGRDLHPTRGIQFEDHIINDTSGNNGAGAHTFDTFSHRPLPNVLVEGGASRTLQVATCINRLKSKRYPGQPLREREQELFELRLNFGNQLRNPDYIRGAIWDTGGDSYDFDSGGTNMGPPVPPPV
jgi:hypothetical protein